MLQALSWHHHKTTIGIVGGLPVDTLMGQVFLKKKKFQTIPYTIATTAKEISFLQTRHPEKLQVQCEKAFLRLQDQGVQKILIYCNSLTSVLDIKSLKRLLKIPLITVEQIYEKIAHQYDSIAILAFNAVSCYGTEKYLFSFQPNLKTMSLGNTEIVDLIEKNIPPKEIINELDLNNYLSMIHHNNFQTLVLACTHFPYLTDTLREISQLNQYKFSITDLNEEFSYFI